MNNRPLILVTNDDGINSPGIEVLKQSMEQLGDVVVVAPESQQSAVSSSLTINKPLRVNKFFKNGSFFGYTVTGTPADCVKLAVSTLLEKKPDLVVSGINHGRNTSINVLYSGTVAGASEGLIAGINSIAISHSSHSVESDLSLTAEYSGFLARKLLNSDYRQKVLLNVNVPDLPENMVKGIKFTRLSSSKWADKYEKRHDPFGNEYYWFAGAYMISETGIDTDDGAVEEGYVSVSPINLNLYNDVTISEIADLLELSDGVFGGNRKFEGGNGTVGTGT